MEVQVIPIPIGNPIPMHISSVVHACDAMLV